MKKIIYLDIWEKGYRNFARIDGEFKKCGFDTLMLHTASFFNKKSQDEKWFNNLLIRDIHFYKTILIKKAIEIESPDIIIILNLSFIFDRTIVNICKSNNIRLVYLAHGKMISAEVVDDERKKLNNTIWQNLGRIICKKNLFVFVNYLSTLKDFQIITSSTRLMWGIIKKPSNYLTFARYDNELDADLLLVYTNQDKTLLSENFGFPENKIKIIGNPEITTFLMTPSLPKQAYLSELGLDKDNKYAVYLDDGLVCDKIITADEWLSNLSEIIHITDTLGLKFIMKLHPRTEKEQFSHFFDNNNIVAVSDCDFKNLLEHSEFVISHLSTTITYALLFNKNVYIPYWGKFANLWQNYPKEVVKYCISLTDFYNKTSANENDNNSNIIDYLKEIGIDININSIKKIVNEISRL